VGDDQERAGWWMAMDGKWYPPAQHPSPAGLGEGSFTAPPSGPPVVAPGPPPGVATPGAQTSSYWRPVLQEPAPVPTGPRSDMFVVGAPAADERGVVRRRPLRWGGAALAAVLVAIGVFVAVSGRTTTWDPRVLGIVHFDEQHRGLTFKHPVAIEFLGNAQFDKQVSVPAPTAKSDRLAMSRALGELRALGLVHGKVNLAASENTLQQADVVGLYVDDKKTVFVRGRAFTPYVRVTLAHELTHALQDQYFDLAKLQDQAKATDGSALTALVEGDAVRIENAYQQSLSPADQQLFQREQAQLDKSSGQTGDVPEILSDILSFPYAFGPTFVDSLSSQGGNTAVDAAFRKPPVAEAQIVDPAAYPVGWKPVRVRVPSIAAGEHRIDTPSPFGQVSLFEVLGSRLGYGPAWAAVQGWQGDNSVPYSDHGKTCVAIDVVMGSADASARLVAAGRQWALSIPGAAVTQAGRRVDLRSCDPGATAPAPPVVTPTAFDVLSARAQVIDAIMTGATVDFAMGRCVADGVIAAVGPGNYGELTSTDLSAAQGAHLQQQVASAAATCRAQGVT